jgi:hypothetical protein
MPLTQQDFAEMRELGTKSRLTESHRRSPGEELVVSLPASEIVALQKALLRAVAELERIYAGK